MTDNNTVADIADDLSNYGEHLLVMIEDTNGHLYEVGMIATRNMRRETVVTIALGDRVQ